MIQKKIEQLLTEVLDSKKKHYVEQLISARHSVNSVHERMEILDKIDVLSELQDELIKVIEKGEQT